MVQQTVLDKMLLQIGGFRFSLTVWSLRELGQEKNPRPPKFDF
jgi:hypothetical protein